MGYMVRTFFNQTLDKMSADLVNRNTPWSWAHFKRSDLPTHFDVADGWTVLDMYQEGVLAATDPSKYCSCSSQLPYRCNSD